MSFGPTRYMPMSSGKQSPEDDLDFEVGPTPVESNDCDNESSKTDHDADASQGIIDNAEESIQTPLNYDSDRSLNQDCNENEDLISEEKSTTSLDTPQYPTTPPPPPILRRNPRRAAKREYSSSAESKLEDELKKGLEKEMEESTVGTDETFLD